MKIFFKKYFCFVSILYLSVLAITDTVRVMTSFLYVSQDYVEILRNILYVLITGYALAHFILFKNDTRFYLVTLAFCFIYSLSYLFSPLPNEFWATQTIYFISRGITGLYLFQNIIDFDLFFKMYKNFIPLFLLYTIVSILSHSDMSVYSMSFSYTIVIPLCFSISYYIITKKLIWLACAAIFIVGIFAYGSRGALAVLGTFSLATIFLSKSSWNSKKIILGVCSLICLLLLLVSYNSILTALCEIFPNSRTLQLVLYGNAFDSTGRDSIYIVCINYISSHIFFIKGFFYDQYIINNALGVMTYPHNFYLELCVQFGLAIATILVSFVSFYIFKAYINARKNKVSFLYFLTLISIAFIPHIFTGSYVVSTYFWIAIGVILVFTRNKKILNTKQ